MINILPIDDVIKHFEGSTCECCPEVIFEEGEIIIIHNALDNRE